MYLTPAGQKLPKETPQGSAEGAVRPALSPAGCSGLGPHPLLALLPQSGRIVDWTSHPSAGSLTHSQLTPRDLLRIPGGLRVEFRNLGILQGLQAELQLVGGSYKEAGF